MRKAVYVEGNEKKIILANCITKSEYEKIYKKNLVCPIDGCKAKLGFREVKKQRDGKYFYIFFIGVVASHLFKSLSDFRLKDDSNNNNCCLEKCSQQG